MANNNSFNRAIKDYLGKWAKVPSDWKPKEVEQ